jgi:hypothetical protein
MPKKDLNKLVDVLIESFPPAQRDRDDEDCDGAVARFWYSKSGSHCVHLEACEHRILVSACCDGGACPPTLENTYSHMRLALLLQWMEKEGTVDELYGMLRNGAFHQKYPLTDPPVTKHMYGGRVTDSLWHDLNVELKKRTLDSMQDGWPI